MTTILVQSAKARAKDEALIRTADKLLADSWNERMRADCDLRPQPGWPASQQQVAQGQPPPGGYPLLQRAGRPCHIGDS